MRTLAKLAVVALVAAVAVRLLRRGGSEAEPAVEMQATKPAPPAPESPAPQSQPPAAEAIEGYCVKERKKVKIADAEKTVAKNGREAVKGVCPDCGTKIFRFV